MSLSFSLRFSGYSSRIGKRFTSAEIFFQAENFRAAHDHAETLLMGMRSTMSYTPFTEIDIDLLKQEGTHGAIPCTQEGANIWHDPTYLTPKE
jgi:hypothetical protein